MLFSTTSKVMALALAIASVCAAEQPAFMRAQRKLQDCSAGGCTGQGSCATGQIQTCHEGKEDECLAADEWEDHCTNHGDLCGACPTDSGSSGCFSGSSLVMVQGKGPVPMDQAQIGDMVLTSAAGYEPLYAFGHYKAEKNSEFLKIKTTVDTLEITAEHLLNVVGKAHPVRADSVNVGDSLVSIEGDARVLKTSTITSQGLFAPLTPSGKIVVNNIVASSYIALTDTDSEIISFGPFSISHSDGVHVVLSPFRLFCMGVTDKPCHVYTDEGISAYISYGMAFVRSFVNSGAWWGYPVVLFAIPFFYSFLAAEMIFGPSLALLAVFTLGLAAMTSRKFAVQKVKTL